MGCLFYYFLCDTKSTKLFCRPCYVFIGTTADSLQRDLYSRFSTSDKKIFSLEGKSLENKVLKKNKVGKSGAIKRNIYLKMTRTLRGSLELTYSIQTLLGRQGKNYGP